MKKSMWFKNVLPKVKAGLIVLVMILAFFVGHIQAARAIPVEEIASLPEAQRTLMEKIRLKISELWQKAGQKTFDAALRNTLNRIASDAAKYVATSGEGQKPLFVTERLDTYIVNLGDAAAGDFIDTLGKNWQVDLCKPADPALTAKIGLGLVQSQRPSAPNCTLSELTSNYASAYEKYAAMKSGDYLKGILASVEPGGSELSATLELFGRTDLVKTVAKEDAKTEQLVKQGWLDVRNIAGKTETAPNYAAMTLEQSNQAKLDAIANAEKGTNPFISAANIFLNQLALEAFQRAQRELAKGQSTTVAYDYSRPQDLFTTVLDYGEAVISEKLASIIKPRFDVKSDYSVLADLVVCQDKNNPGPNNCVIDDNFSQAISEKLTVAEALEKDYLHKNWLISNNDKLENTYTLRSFSILRKFRVIPVGWEQAINIAAKNGYQATLMDLVDCFSPNDKYKDDFSEAFGDKTQSWCEGLVDPNWVLKTPPGKCLKQGVGGQILSSFNSTDANGVSSVAVSRNDEYCADEQSCIKENNDGSCEVYGYCNEEKRTWNFNAESCSPINNTCQTFINNSNNQTASYLENTLDYGTCNSGNAGCKQYVYGGTYNNDTKQVAWNDKYSIYFNNQVAGCNAKDEGCTTLLRGKPGWFNRDAAGNINSNNVNYVMNSDFSQNSAGDSLAAGNLKWPVAVNKAASIVNFDGTKTLLLEGNSGSIVKVYSDNINNLLPKGMSVIPGWSYTLSAQVYLEEGTKATMLFSEDNLKAEVTATKSWQTLTVSAISGVADINDLKFSISGEGGAPKMYVRNVQLSPDDMIVGYTNYGANPQPEKIIPAYLESACYASVGTGTNDYRLKADAPDVCKNFARKCNKEEVGCTSFKSAKDGFVIAAKANTADYCREECNNYDTYIAREAYFFNASADNLIPAKTKTCSAQSAGCASFTNLDEISQGGETQEYYTYIRQCIKPDANSCGDFYSWEGTSGAGYQLKALSLKKDNTGNPALVDNSASLAAACTKEIYYLPATDPRYNPDCREFYNKNGSITYSLISNTFSCSDNCHTYRLNEKNIDKNLDAASCTNTDVNNPTRHWDASQGACYVCKNGGKWDTKYNTCLYSSIPNEGTTCTASELGCREYNGNGGEKLRRVASYGFETDLTPFVAKSGAIAQSLESTAKDGHSLAYNGGELEIDAQSLTKKGAAYVIKFMAKSAGQITVNAYFENANQEKAIFNVSDLNPSGNLLIQGGGDWNLYEVNVNPIAHDIKTEKLRIKISGPIFIDNFIINEITDRFYLIKGTSQIPDRCYYDIFGKYQGPNYNLGCSLYTDKSSTPYYLHRFSELCQDSAAGCEQMIETNNSTNSFAKTINLAGDRNVACTAGAPGCLSLPGHKIVYAVYDPTKACLSEDAGCTRFAYSQATATSVNWVDAYKKNLPDKYDSTLCQIADVGCEAWSFNDQKSSAYFKNPGSNVCVYRSNNWYKAAVRRCDSSGDGKITGAEQAGGICSTDTECGTNKKCIVDNNDYACNVTYLKTIGLGGAGGAVPVPSDKVGLCEPAAAGCSEFIDPVSGYMNNVLSDKATSEPYKIKPNSLYILNGAATLSGFTTSDNKPGSVRILDKDNNLSPAVSTINGSATAAVIFHTGVNARVNITGMANGTTLKEAIINYRVGNDLDLTTCNGVVNTENGCVLFNSRNINHNDGQFNKLIFNAAASEGLAAQACSSGNCSANQVIKVRPDRVCSRWLSCTSYIEDPVTKERVCYEMGECDKLDDNNECGNVLADTKEVRAIDTGTNNSATNWNTLINKNATGYALLNNYYLGSMKEVGQNTDAHFDFENNNSILSCKRFDNSACDEKFLKDSLILEPNGSPSGISYPAHGKGYLRVLSYYKISPLSEGSYIYVYGNQDYYVNYLVNTNGSADQAKLEVTDENGNVIASSLDKTTGWERKVLKFNVAGTKSLKKVRIYLTSDTKLTQNSFVYFDDINIEPVLQVAPDKYVAKDCRLYPGADSLSCLSANNNVVKDGLFGYCLQYDPLNPNSCLMWYPVDKIAPVTRSTQADLGYKGKFPLYYCTEVNGNFQLIKKIKGVAHADGGCSNCTGKDWQEATRWAAPSGTKDFNPKSVECKFPDLSINDACRCLDTDSSKVICGSDNYIAVGGGDYEGSFAGANTFDLTYSCIPNPSKFVLRADSLEESTSLLNGNCKIVYRDGWVPYGDGFLNKTHVFSPSAGNTDVAESQLSNINEAENNNPAVAIFDYSNPPATEKDLTYPFNADPDQVYRLACNSFAQLVDAESNNMAWVDRVSRASLFPTSTPTYFYSSAKETPANVNYFGDGLKKKITGVVHTMTGCSEAGSGSNCKDADTGLITATKLSGASNPTFVDCKDLSNKLTIPSNCKCLDTNSSKEVCGSDDYYAIAGWNVEGDDFMDFKSYTYHTSYQCIPNPNKLVTVTANKTTYNTWGCNVGYQEGLVPYGNGLMSHPYVFDPSDHNTNTDVKESELSNISEIIQPLSDTEKPIFAYGRNREDVPFGAAILPSDYSLVNSQLINLRNQYSAKNNETLLAGRPYGCSGKMVKKTVITSLFPIRTKIVDEFVADEGCISIGQCNLNPNIFCIYTNDNNVNKQSCAAAGAGECTILWRKPLLNQDSVNILSKLFIKKYAGYAFSPSTGTYNSIPNPETAWSMPANCSLSDPTKRPDTHPASFCKVQPAISNVIIKRVVNKNKLEDVAVSNGEATITKNGLYKLSFNTEVNSEQQPLKQIVVDWDSANISNSDVQIITGVDNKPNTPHELYHYYLAENSKKIVEIRIMDNWNMEACRALGNIGCRFNSVQ
jgi:hypothetical protein